MDLNFKTGSKFALELDKSDNLASYRTEFYASDEKLIYLDGNSLGRLPLKSIDRINEVVKHQWGDRLIRSWNEHWLDMSDKASAKLAKLLGADPAEVLICDSTSLNLFKLVLGTLKLNPDRKTIISYEFNFPSDLYVIDGVIKLLDKGHLLKLVKSSDGIAPNLESLYDMLNEDVGLLTLSHVVFKSSYKYDVENITKKVHSFGGKVLWDLSHSAGAVPIELNKWDVDFAIGCTYKYLNSGPGSVAYLYIRKDLINKVNHFIQGWFGADEPFKFGLDYSASNSIRKFSVGTPHILSTAPIEPALDILLDADIDNLREKSIELSEYFIFLFDQYLSDLGFNLCSPRDYNYRGSHLSISHPEAYRICQALIKSDKLETNVIPDFRTPDNIRFGIAPLYNSFSDIYTTVECIRQVINSGEYENFSNVISDVT